MNVLVAILALIAFIASKIYQLIKVPKGLENVPTINYLSFFVTMVGPDKRWETSREILEKEGIGKAWFDGEWIIIICILNPYSKNRFQNQYYGENLLLSNGDVWKRHRRIANPSFRNLPVHIFVESVMKLLNVMEKVDNEPIEIKNYMHRMTLDVLGRAAFGFDFNV
ncbi:cytochrome P450 [Rhizophagus clarus]|uniref:Cytochrome P450 n=1 Tax=Rhizophagus clarus TaxID=94130 RepID=A0A8H3MIK8_9GLOM|nr:cytochrome P450 [Rhizophagus clarus]